MNGGPHTNSMNLVEQIAFYATLVLLHGQNEADDFLATEVQPEWHQAIRACVNDKGTVINSRGGEFFVEHYTGVLMADWKGNP